MLSSERLVHIPIIYLTTDDVFELTETEKKNVKIYFDNGGFMFLDNPTPILDYSKAEASLKQMLRDTHAECQVSVNTRET